MEREGVENRRFLRQSARWIRRAVTYQTVCHGSAAAITSGESKTIFVGAEILISSDELIKKGEKLWGLGMK